jgi:hypothetical protein
MIWNSGEMRGVRVGEIELQGPDRDMPNVV